MGIWSSPLVQAAARDLAAIIASRGPYWRITAAPTGPTTGPQGKAILARWGTKGNDHAPRGRALEIARNSLQTISSSCSR